MVDVVYWPDIPKLLNILKTHLDVELLEHDNRSFYEFHEPLPFEQVEIAKLKAEREVS